MIDRKYSVLRVERSRMFVAISYLILLMTLCSCEAPKKSLNVDFSTFGDLNISDQNDDQTVVLKSDSDVASSSKDDDNDDKFRRCFSIRSE